MLSQFVNRSASSTLMAPVGEMLLKAVGLVFQTILCEQTNLMKNFINGKFVLILKISPAPFSTTDSSPIICSLLDDSLVLSTMKLKNCSITVTLNAVVLAMATIQQFLVPAKGQGDSICSYNAQEQT